MRVAFDHFVDNALPLSNKAPHKKTIGREDFVDKVGWIAFVVVVTSSPLSSTNNKQQAHAPLLFGMT